MNTTPKENPEVNTDTPATPLGVVDPSTFVGGDTEPKRAGGKKKAPRLDLDEKRVTVDIAAVLADALDRAKTPTRLTIKQLVTTALATHPPIRAELERLGRDYPTMRNDVAAVLAAYPVTTTDTGTTDVPPDPEATK
jgi:hypothetical protein